MASTEEDDVDDDEEVLQQLEAQLPVIQCLSPDEVGRKLASLKPSIAVQLLLLMGDEEKRAAAVATMTSPQRTALAAAVPADATEALGLGATVSEVKDPSGELEVVEGEATNVHALEDAKSGDAEMEEGGGPLADADRGQLDAWSMSPESEEALVPQPAAANLGATPRTDDVALEAAETKVEMPLEELAQSGASAETCMPEQIHKMEFEEEVGHGEKHHLTAEATTPPTEADVEQMRVGSSPVACSMMDEEQEPEDGIKAAWVINNRGTSQWPEIIPVSETMVDHSRHHRDERLDSEELSEPDLEAEAARLRAANAHSVNGMASWARGTSIPTGMSKGVERALGAAGTAAGMARQGFAQAADSSRQVAGAASCAAVAARQRIEQAAPAKVVELGGKAKGAASSVAEKARQSFQQARERGTANEAKEKAKEKLAGAAESAKVSLASVSRSVSGLMRKS